MDLCLSCGLCCTGALFGHVDLEPEEARRLAARRLPLHEGGRRLRQPCPAHDGRCTVYEDRPRNCAAYECDVLGALAGGAMTHAEAVALVDRARALAASVRAQVPGEAALWADVAAFTQDGETWRREHADLLLDLAILRRALGRFRRFDEPPATGGG